MLRMEDYLATQSIFLRQVGHLSFWKKNAIKFYYQNPNQYSLNAEEADKIKNILSRNLNSNDKVISVLSGQAMITNSCLSLPILFTGVDPADLNWIYSHPQVLREIPELTKFDRGAGFWTRNSDLVPINMSPVLFSLLKKQNILTEIVPSANLQALDCKSPDSAKKIAEDPFVQIFAQASDGGLGVTDAAISGLMSTGFSFTDETSVLLPFQTAQNLLRTDHISRIAVILEKVSELEKLQAALNRELQQNHIQNVEIHSYREEQVSEIYRGAMNFVYVMISFFAVLVCGVVILSIANSLQISFLERKPEIASLRSIGFRPQQIQILFSFEYLIISFVSFCFGGFLAFLLKFLNNHLNFRFRIPGFANDLQFVLQPTFIYTYSVLISMLIIVLLTTWIISRKMMLQKIIDLMRA